MSNVFLRSEKLSLKAKGFLAYVLSLPDAWDFSLSGAVSVLPEGKDAIRAIINELKREGYCTYVQERDEKGKMSRGVYSFFETPVTEEPLTESPKAENPFTENPTQINKDINKYYNKTNTEKNNIYNPVSEEMSCSSDLDNNVATVEDFEECWVAYNRKGSKKVAKAQWLKLKLTKEDVEGVKEHIRHYVGSREKSYCKDFERYLRDRVFESVVFSRNNVVYDPFKAPITNAEQTDDTLLINGVIYR